MCGDMGGPMARNLLAAGFEVVCHDIQSERLAALVDCGAAPAQSARDVADRADIVFSCLDKVDAMYAVASDCAAGGRMAVYVDMSTSGPSVAKDVRTCFDGTAVSMLDMESNYIGKFNFCLYYLVCSMYLRMLFTVSLAADRTA